MAMLLTDNGSRVELITILKYVMHDVVSQSTVYYYNGATINVAQLTVRLTATQRSIGLLR